MGKGSTTTTSNSSPPPQFLSAYTNLLEQANTTLAQNRYQNYSGQLVAGLQPAQTTAINEIGNAQGIADPYINSAAQEFGQATTPLWPGVAPVNSSTINQYMSPYTGNVTQATQEQFANLNAQQQNSLEGNAIAQGAFGGDRASVAQGILGAQQTAQEAPVLAGIQQQGYTTALQTAEQQQQAQLGANEANSWLNSQAAFGLGNLGQEAEGTSLEGATSLLGAGSLEQQIAQEQLNVPYEQFEAAQAAPYQEMNWLAGITEGAGAGAGGQSSTTEPGPSTGQQVAGGVMDAAAIAALFALRRGGAVPRGILFERRGGGGGILPFDVGGGVPSNFDYLAGLTPPKGSRGISAPPPPPGVNQGQQEQQQTQGLMSLAMMAANRQGAGAGGDQTDVNSALLADSGYDPEISSMSGAGAGTSGFFKRGGIIADDLGGAVPSNYDYLDAIDAPVMPADTVPAPPPPQQQKQQSTMGIRRGGLLPYRRASGGSTPGFSFITAPNGVEIPQLTGAGSGGGTSGAPSTGASDLIPSNLVGNFAPPPIAARNAAPAPAPGAAPPSSASAPTTDPYFAASGLSNSEIEGLQQSGYSPEAVNEYAQNPGLAAATTGGWTARGGRVAHRQDGGALDEDDSYEGASSLGPASAPGSTLPPPPAPGADQKPAEPDGILPSSQAPGGEHGFTDGDRLAVAGMLADLGAQAVSRRPNYGAAIAQGIRGVMQERNQQQEADLRKAQEADTAAYRKADLGQRASEALDRAQTAAGRLKQEATAEQDRKDEAAATLAEHRSDAAATLDERKSADAQRAAYQNESLAQLRGTREAQEAAARSEADLRNLEGKRSTYEPGMGADPNDPTKQVQGAWETPTYGGSPVFHAGMVLTPKSGATPQNMDPKRVAAINTQFDNLLRHYQSIANSDNPPAGFKMPSNDEIWNEAQGRVNAAYGQQQPGAAPSVTTPPDGAISALRANPQLRAQFDQKYGPGASAQYLGAQ